VIMGMFRLFILLSSFMTALSGQSFAQDVNAKSLLLTYQMVQGGLMGASSQKELAIVQNTFQAYIDNPKAKDLNTTEGKKLLELNARLKNSFSTYPKIQKCMESAGVKSNVNQGLPSYSELIGTRCVDTQVQKLVRPILEQAQRENTIDLLNIVSTQAEEDTLYAALEFKARMYGVQSIDTDVKRAEVIRELFDLPKGSTYTRLSSSQKNELEQRAKAYTENELSDLTTPLTAMDIAPKLNAVSADFKKTFDDVQAEDEAAWKKIKDYGQALQGSDSKHPGQDMADFRAKTLPNTDINPWIKARLQQTYSADEGSWGVLMFTPAMQEYFSAPVTRYGQLQPTFKQLPSDPASVKKIVDRSKDEAYYQIKSFGQSVSQNNFSKYYMDKSDVPIETMRTRMKELINNDPVIIPQLLQKHPEYLTELCKMLLELKYENAMKKRSQEEINKAMEIGGAICGAILIASQVGAFAAPAVMSASAGWGAVAAYVTDVAAVGATVVGVHAISKNVSKMNESLRNSVNLKAAFFSNYGRDFSRYVAMNAAWNDYEQARFEAIQNGAITLIFAEATWVSLKNLSEVQRLAKLQEMTTSLRNGTKKIMQTRVPAGSQ